MPKIRIVRKSYVRKAYTRSDGVRVKRARVPKTSFLIDDPGKVGRRARGAKAGPYKGQKAWIRREGKIGGPGYTTRSATDRHRDLNRAVGKYGYRSTLGSLQVLLRSTTISREKKNRIARDKEWLKSKYGGSGSFGGR
jgi:hypothetical protein